MISHDQIRDELVRQIDAGTLKQADVARKLSIAPARIAEVRRGTRRIQPGEMHILAGILGLARPLNMWPALDEVEEIPHLGRVAQGVWLEQSEREPDPRDMEFVPYDKAHGDPAPMNLFAVTPEGTSMDLAFKPGTRLICRHLFNGGTGFVSGDYVIAERRNHELTELTCKRVEIADDGTFWLHSESSDPKYQEPWRIGKPDKNHHLDTQIQIIAKVIRAVQDFEAKPALARRAG